jgi:hypothetical protein
MKRAVSFSAIFFTVLATMTVGAYAKDFSLTSTSLVPAAAGKMKVKRDRNGNTELTVEVKHLAKPSALSPARANYVVWLQPRGDSARNAGELAVNNNLDGKFETTTPTKAFDVFVTAEDSLSVQAPSGPEVMRGTVQP